MKKFGTFILLIFCACVIGSCYGIAHDQLTFSISPEYYTKFKFIQFEIGEEGQKIGQPRLAVALVGVMATWWMGMFIGIVLSFIGIIHNSWTLMFKFTINAFLIALAVAFIAGLTGLAYGYSVLSYQPRQNFSHWFIPRDLVDFKNFIAVGSMHNFSYLGGTVGLIAGALYSVSRKAGLKNGIFWWTKRPAI